MGLRGHYERFAACSIFPPEVPMYFLTFKVLTLAQQVFP
jgi:hypothetical protein